jgi:hypothetical protein
MMFEVHRAMFLKPSDILYDLLTLQHAEAGTATRAEDTFVRYFPPGVLEQCIERLISRDLISMERSTGRLTLTAAGRKQVRVLMVDYTRELSLLYEEMLGFFKRKLMEFYMSGVRSVAFYPIGDTARVAELALISSGLTLTAAIDDDPLLWGAEFHGRKIEALDAILNKRVDAIVLTTSVFEAQLRQRISALGPLDVKVLSMWQ